jgi:hypothetical protein
MFCTFMCVPFRLKKPEDVTVSERHGYPLVDINPTNGLDIRNAIWHLQFPKRGENHERVVRSWNRQPNYYHEERVSK